MRTETLSIVFTDLKGYTAATSAQTHQENAQMLRRVERIVEPVVKAYSGVVIKSIGDAYMIVFRSPTEAVRCATAVQDRLHQHNTNSSPEHAIHLRIAMNIGEVRVHRGDVFGEPVNIAARVEAVTPADEIYLTQSMYLTMNRSEIPIEEVGEYELKGIPEPVRVYRVKRFAHLSEDDTTEGEPHKEPGEDGEATIAGAGLPYGGTQLAHWHKMRWLQHAYQAMWVLAVVGVVGAGYLRYKPSSSYDHLVEQARLKAEENLPQEVFAAAGQIPAEARRERNEVRKYRRIAVGSLLRRGDIEGAEEPLEQLLREDPRDAEALVLRGLLSHQKADSIGALDALEVALKTDPALGARDGVAEAVAAAYIDANTLSRADVLVGTILAGQAAEPLASLLNEGKLTTRRARLTASARLDKLGSGDRIDRVKLHIADLTSSSCKVKKGAIAKLVAAGDDRAVGPLMKISESKACGASQARGAISALLK